MIEKNFLETLPDLSKVKSPLRGVVKGSVQNLRLVNSFAHPFLVRAAMEEVKQWRYEPSLLNGEPIEVVRTIAVNFRLSE